LRTFAIGAVLLTHSNFGFGNRTVDWWRSWGWFGVDLFFVISGYLITSILLAAKDQPNYFRNFYARRGLRIWPLYYLLLLYVFVLSRHMGPWFDQHIDYGVYKWQYYIFYLQNLVLTHMGSFCLVITWSLCVEEQFYLVWPLFVRFLSRRWLTVVAIAVVLCGTPFRMYLHAIHSHFGFFATYTRLDPIAVGALIAMHPKWFKYTWIAAAPWAYWLLRSGNFDWNYLALALAFGSAVTYAATKRNRFLASRPMTFVGRISYGIYIWHPIVFSLFWATPLYKLPAKWGVPSIYFMLMQCALTIPIAALSWNFIEKPILKLKRYFEHDSASRSAALRGIPEPQLATGD
jgi:peptidoglycan/LPS O-acetylase OafA/YrhL